MPLRTGDLLLFCESRSLVDRFLRWSTGSKWTHVGLVLVDPPGLPRGVYMAESGGEAEPDVLSGENVFGVQLQFLSHVVDANTYVRRLHPPLDAEQQQHLWALVGQLDGTPYDTSPADWLRAAARLREGRAECEQRTDRFWCSALVAYLYVKLDLLPAQTPWTLVAPVEWADPELATLNLLGGRTLGPIEKACVSDS